LEREREERNTVDIDSLPVDEQKRLIQDELARRLAKRDLQFLMTDVLGYPMTDEIHREIAEFLASSTSQEGRRRALLLIPRGHLKSTLVTVCWTIQRIISDPNIRILISNGYLENAKSFLREIKSHFERSERFRALFGDLVNADDKWTETQIVVKTRSQIRKEPTIQVSSVDKSVVSQHYDLIIGDDLVNRENINTKEQRQKVQLYYKDLYDLIEPSGAMVFIGTRWHFDDLYGRIIVDNATSRNFDVMVRTCWADQEKRIPLFPLKFTADYIDTLKRDKGSYEFSAQYMNNPTDDDDADFKREWIRIEPLFKLEANPLAIYITIDPAMTKTEGSDYSGFVVNGVDENGQWRILRAYRKRLDPSELIDEIFFLHGLYASRFRRMGIEKTAYTVGLRQTIQNEMIRRKRFFDIVEVEHKQRNKGVRIRALVPRFESGRIVMSEYCSDLVEELLSFPRAEHEDTLDACAYQLDMADDAQPFGLNEITGGSVIRVIKPKFQTY
jgi:predicted phage terminase large subunit-like protein